MKELLTLIIQNIESFELSAQFRKGQKPFYDAIIKSLKEDKTTMFVKGPTGMGKTFLEAVLAAALIGNSDIKILLLTSKITLLQQIQREFKRFVGFLKTGLFGGGFKNYHEQVTIMTYDSFRNLNENIAKQYSVVLLDEGHKGLGKKTKEQLEKQKNFSILIGFTASDEYSKEKSLTTFLLHKAHELSIEEAVEIGMLSNIKVMIASVDIEIDNQHTGESRGDYEERISSEIIREGGNIATARLYKRVFAKRNLRGIALVLTTLQGRDLVEECAKEGIKAELIHSGLKRDEREDMFTRFRNNEFTVLVGMGIIKEGFDDPGVSVAITTYPVSSRVDMTQFPGRAERIDEQNPDKVAYIVNLAYKAKKQLFYTDILDGKSEVRQKKVRKKKLDIISSDEMQGAIATKPESYITNVAVTEEEVKEVMRNVRGLDVCSKEEIIQLAKSELKKYQVIDRFSLIKFGPSIFTSSDFGPFGKGTSFANYLLPNFNSYEGQRISLNTLDEIAKKLNWTDRVKTLDRAIEELAKHGITDRVSLMELGSEKFKKLDFGPFGKTNAFASWLLCEKNVRSVNKEAMGRIAKKLNWTDRVKTLDRAIEELAKHGITDRVSLMELGSEKFKKLEFGRLGKSKAFARWFLQDIKVGTSINYKILEKIAKKLNWTDRVKTLDRAIEELAKHGITDRVSLMELGSEKFKKLDFGPFGQGKGFTNWVLSDRGNKNVTNEALNEIAIKLNLN